MSADSRASRTWSSLIDAMQDHEPACQDDDRFILDDQPAHTLTYLCDVCPLVTLCHAYAEANRPAGGIWAGKRYGTRNPRQETP